MKTWASRLAILGSLATLTLVLLGLPLWMFGLPLMLEQSARALAPPAYPNAVRLKTTLVSAAGEATEISDYHVADDVIVVQRWMEARGLHFNSCAITHNRECVVSEHCDDGVFMRRVMQSLQLGELDPRGQTCVSVVLEPDPNVPHHMFLHVNINWPSNN